MLLSTRRLVQSLSAARYAETELRRPDSLLRNLAQTQRPGLSAQGEPAAFRLMAAAVGPHTCCGTPVRVVIISLLQPQEEGSHGRASCRRRYCGSCGASTNDETSAVRKSCASACALRQTPDRTAYTCAQRSKSRCPRSVCSQRGGTQTLNVRLGVESHVLPRMKPRLTASKSYMHACMWA